jgi:hypothetical protein
MSENKSTTKEEPLKIDAVTEKEIKEKALTNILDIIKFELKEDEENFKMLPLSDFQKEELLFDYLKEDKKELFKKYQDVRSIYDIQKKKELEQQKLESLVSIMEATGEELQKEEDDTEWEKRLSPSD